MPITEQSKHWTEWNPGWRSTAIFRCGGCGKDVLTYWAEPHGGLLRGPYTLAGDVIFHDGCWDRYIQEYPVCD